MKLLNSKVAHTLVSLMLGVGVSVSTGFASVDDTSEILTHYQLSSANSAKTGERRAEPYVLLARKSCNTCGRGFRSRSKRSIFNRGNRGYQRGRGRNSSRGRGNSHARGGYPTWSAGHDDQGNWYVRNGNENGTWIRVKNKRVARRTARKLNKAQEKGFIDNGDKDCSNPFSGVNC